MEEKFQTEQDLSVLKIEGFQSDDQQVDYNTLISI